MRSILVGIGALWIALTVGCSPEDEEQRDLDTSATLSDLSGAPLIVRGLETTLREGIIVTRVNVDGATFEVSTEREIAGPVAIESSDTAELAVFSRTATETSVARVDRTNGEEWNVTNLTPSSAAMRVDVDQLVRAARNHTLPAVDVARLRVALPVALFITERWAEDELFAGAALARATVEAFGASLLPENRMSHQPDAPEAGDTGSVQHSLEYDEAFEIEEGGGSEGQTESCSASGPAGSCSARCTRGTSSCTCQDGYCRCLCLPSN